MTSLLTGFHPSFESLSTVADQCDVDAARTRVGRHVARCATCTQVVAEIRALGESARGVELPGAPADLWARIEGARAAGGDASAVPAGPRHPETPAVGPRRMHAAGRRGGIAAAIAAVVVGLLLLPSPFARPLQASPEQGRWRFMPAQARAGETVQVRFEPPASFPHEDRVLLLAQALSRWGDRPVPGRDGLMDSVATLVRGADGAYSGSMTVPTPFVALRLQLTPMGGGFFPTPRDTAKVAHAVDLGAGRPGALLVAADASGRPRLDALSSAAIVGDRWPARAGSLGYSVADTLIRYYPSEPIGYAADRRVGGRRLLDDVIAYFRRGERQYVRFEQRFMAQPTVSADRELAMAALARRISEPEEAERWVMRLVREHPDDPRTLAAFTDMLSARFTRPDMLERVQRDLPIADSLYQRNGHVDLSGEVASIAARAGDTAAYRRWSVRALQQPEVPRALWHAGDDPALLTRPATRQVANAYLETRVAEPCRLAPGIYPVQVSREYWMTRCQEVRGNNFATLSALARLDGDPRRALAYADSAVAQSGAAGRCFYIYPHQRRGEALLAMGDTAAAVAELALRSAQGSWQSHAFADSIGRLLRPNVDSATWARAAGQGRAAIDRCRSEMAELQRQTRARNKAMGAPEFYR